MRRKRHTNLSPETEENQQISTVKNSSNWLKKLFTAFLIITLLVAAITGVGLFLQWRREKRFEAKIINGALEDSEFKRPITNSMIEILKDLSEQAPLESEIFMNSPFNIYLISYRSRLPKTARGHTFTEHNEVQISVFNEQPDFHLGLTQSTFMPDLKNTAAHEINHAVNAMINSDENCNPGLLFKNIYEQAPLEYEFGDKTLPVLALPQNISAILQNYADFDDFSKKVIRPLLEKKKTTILEKDEQELLSNLEQTVSDYVPRSFDVLLHLEDTKEQKQIYQNIVNGLSKSLESNETYPYFFSKFNYTLYIQSVSTYGPYAKITGLTTKDPNDKLSAFISDFEHVAMTTTLRESNIKMPFIAEDKIKEEIKIKNSYEEDAERQSVGNAKYYFFEPARKIHRNNMKKSKCGMVRTAVENYEQSEKFVSDQEMAAFYQKIRNPK